MRRLLAVLLLASTSAIAAPDVKIGVVYGHDSAAARAAVATALSVVNETHAPIPVLMGTGGGLDRLGGAMLRPVEGEADDPARAEAEAERLITDEHVVALLAVAARDQDAAIRRVATRHTIPYLSLTSDPAPTLAPDSELAWDFTLGPTGAMTSAALFRFLPDQAVSIQTIGLVYEDEPRITALADVQRKRADDAGLKRVVQLNLLPNAPGLATEVETIVENKPDAIVATLGAGNATLLVRSLAERHALPLLLGQGGFCTDPAFANGLGTVADGVVCAASFAPDATSARPSLPALDAAFQARAGSPLDTQAAETITAVLLLADVIDRAGSTKPLDLRTALMATDAAGDKLPVAWSGVRFDGSGQNVLAAPALRQMQGGAYRTVAPDELAVAKPVLPAPK